MRLPVAQPEKDHARKDALGLGGIIISRAVALTLSAAGPISLPGDFPQNLQHAVEVLIADQQLALSVQVVDAVISGSDDADLDPLAAKGVDYVPDLVGHPGYQAVLRIVWFGHDALREVSNTLPRQSLDGGRPRSAARVRSRSRWLYGAAR
jgi:hypothetical protein